MPFITQGKTNIKYIFIVTVAAAVAAGGILNWKYSVVDAEISRLTTFLELSKSEENTNETEGLALSDVEGWETYISKYFSFKYPSDWFYESPFWLPSEENISFFHMGTKADHGYGEHKGNEVLNLAFSVRGESIDKIKNDYYPSAEDIMVAGKKAIRISDNHVLISVSGDKTIHISGQNLDQILSTFRFLK